MRRISYSLTTPQFRARTKDVTRRLGWGDLEAGEQLMGIEKGMGLRKGERQVELGAVEVISVRAEPLDAITPEEVVREGFPEMTPAQFVAMFCQHNRCTPSTVINRIEYRYLEGPMGKPAAPPLKWPGGKGRLLPELVKRLPPDADRLRHVELFAGGGALFFHRRPARALLADNCAPLVELYSALQLDPEAVLRSLRALARHHSEAHYYAVRSRFNGGNGSEAQRAAMLLYLNRAGYNGLFRQNAAGEYNVPFGDARQSTLCQAERLRDCAQALEGARIHHGDFELCARTGVVGAGDFVYLDPPYVPICETSFHSYGAGGFHYDDHVRLRDLAEKLDRAGARVMISNSDTMFVRDIYRRWRIDPVDASRSIAARGKSRGKVRELVIRNYGGGK